MTKLLNKIDQQTGFVAKDCLYIKESSLKKQYFNREVGNLSSITLSFGLPYSICRHDGRPSKKMVM